MNTQVQVQTRGQGLYEFTDHVRSQVARWHAATTTHEGLCTLFIQHTSASLLIQENADPSAKHDLEAWLKRLVPENDPAYTHTAEGPDDMPAHLKAAMTPVSLSIPIMDGKLALGRWQGIYLWEHRSTPHTRTVVIHIA
jgi:secondary thiamine-phosphate synthase enzyme